MMATRKPNPAAGTSARTAAGLVPVTLALVMQSVLPGGGSLPSNTAGGQAAICADDIGDFHTCHSQYPTGCTKAGKYDAALNLLKNRLVPPSTPPVKFLGQPDVADLESKLPKGLVSNNHASFTDQLKALGEGKVYGLKGYLYYAQPGGKSESANCQLGEPDAIDFHIGIGFDPKLAGKILAKKEGTGTLTPDDNSTITKTSMIVEMTPHYRFQFQPDWNLPTVEAMVGHQVRVIGQLLVDNEHFISAADCGIDNGDKCWRATVWELHPVMQFQVCNSTSVCDDNSPDWVELGAKPPAKTPSPTRSAAQ